MTNSLLLFTIVLSCVLTIFDHGRIFARAGMLNIEQQQDTCVNCDACAMCVSRSFFDAGSVQVVIDFSNCKNEETISWGCCRGSSNTSTTGEDANQFCDLHTCDASLDNWDPAHNKCDEVTQTTFLVPNTAQSIVIQLYDGKFIGDVDCTSPNSNCCGGAGTSCDAVSGVCQVAIDLSECGGEDECITDANCAHLNDACAIGVCDQTGTCIQQYKPHGTICRPALDLCDVPEVCSGVSTQCPPDFRDDHGYTFKCGTTQYLCAVETGDLVKNNGNAWVLGNNTKCTIGTARQFVALPWPSCVTKCIVAICPNNKQISNYALSACNTTTGLWECTEKHDTGLYHEPVCPFA